LQNAVSGRRRNFLTDQNDAELCVPLGFDWRSLRILRRQNDSYGGGISQDNGFPPGAFQLGFEAMTLFEEGGSAFVGAFYFLPQLLRIPRRINRQCQKGCDTGPHPEGNRETSGK
jgi:hypothetical protein